VLRGDNIYIARSVGFDFGETNEGAFKIVSRSRSLSWI